jgi:hypothetical protein
VRSTPATSYRCLRWVGIHGVRPVPARKLRSHSGSPTHADRADLGGGDQLLAVGAAAVGQLTALQVGPQHLDRVQLRRVRRQIRKLQPRLGGRPVLQVTGVVGAEVVPASVKTCSPTTRTKARSKNNSSQVAVRCLPLSVSLCCSRGGRISSDHVITADPHWTLRVWRTTTRTGWPPSAAGRWPKPALTTSAAEAWAVGPAPGPGGSVRHQCEPQVPAMHSPRSVVAPRCGQRWPETAAWLQDASAAWLRCPAEGVPHLVG